MSETLLAELIAFGQVVLIDLVLAGDNAIVVGVAASGVPRDQRSKVIMLGIGAAVVLRIVFALATTQLLGIIGLTFAGGLLLLWVCWKLYRELCSHRAEDEAAENLDNADDPRAGSKSFRSAVWAIVLADVSMSLDNVLAVAGAAREHLWVLVLGLLLSVALMGAAASLIARLLARYHWIAYVGLLVIVYVALRMIWEGGAEILAATALLG
jgi:YjbE family integral membrane protein